jgi:membrane protein implicated in regulation of membrane protease activity
VLVVVDREHDGRRERCGARKHARAFGLCQQAAAAAAAASTAWWHALLALLLLLVLVLLLRVLVLMVVGPRAQRSAGDECVCDRLACDVQGRRV